MAVSQSRTADEIRAKFGTCLETVMMEPDDERRLAKLRVFVKTDRSPKILRRAERHLKALAKKLGASV